MSQRRSIVSLAMLAAWIVPALAGEDATVPERKTLTPAALKAYIERSSLKFDLGVGSDQNFVVEPAMRCERRPMEFRVIQAADGSKSLVASQLDPGQQAILDAAEQHFLAKRPSQALELYTKLIEQNPSDPTLWVFYGDAQFQLEQFKSALDSYRHAIELDPTQLYAHAFAADALLHLDRPAEAREHWLKALSLDPTYDQISVAAVPKLAAALGVSLDRISIEPPEAIGERRENRVPLMIPGPQLKPWMMYVFCKALWRHDESFRRDRGETGPRPSGTTSFREESECLNVALMSRLSLLPKGDLAQLDPTSARMLAALKAGVWDGMVLWEVVGRRCPTSLSLLEEQSRQAIEQYLETMVIKPLK